MTKSESMRNTRARREQAERFNISEQILITQVVGSIIPGGDQHPLQAAFEQVAEFMAQNLNPEGDVIGLEFEINGFRFHAEGCPPRETNGAVAEPTEY